MNSGKSKSGLLIELLSLRDDCLATDNPTADQLKELMLNPGAYSKDPLFEDIHLHSYTLNLERGVPGEVCGRVDLYFDHNGKVFMDYEDSVTSSYGKLRDLACNSDGCVEVIGIEDREPFEVLNRYIVPVEVALPFVLEFGKSGEIDLLKKPWEVIRYNGRKMLGNERSGKIK